MRLTRLSMLVFATVGWWASQAQAVDRVWTGAVNNGFFTSGNWTTGVPTDGEDQLVLQGGANLPAVIPAGTGTVELGAIQLGYNTADPGKVIQNGGTLLIKSFVPSSATGFASDYRSHIGRTAGGESSWVMNNDSVILYDDPTGANGGGLGSNGTNTDLEIGAQSGAAGGVGRLELHDTSVLRISDDLKIGAENNGNAVVVADGNSQITVGSGISVSENTSSHGVLTIAQNAVVVSGNSAGAGNDIDGRTDEGYLTLSVNSTSTADVTLKDNAKLYIRTLQQRDGVTNFTIQDSAQFHVFDTFKYAEPNLGNATMVTGSARTSHLSSNASSNATITIKGNGVMSVDSDVDGAGWSGLAVGGGNNSGGNAAGGKALIAVQDHGKLSIQQNLWVGIGNGASTDATLQVQGPDASVNVKGDLLVALQPDLNPTPGVGRIREILTGASQGTIVVNGTADLSSGLLDVQFSGYSPRGGESYTLLTAGSIPSDFFGVSLPSLPSPLSWQTTRTATSYKLDILGSLGLVTDLNHDGAVDAADAGIMFGDWGGPGSTSAADFNKDGFVDAADAGTMFADWTGDPSVPGSNAATAEYNFETGELKISSAGAVNVFVQSASSKIVPLNPAPVVPVGLLTNNASRVGITNLGPINVSNFSFGTIGAGLAMGDLKLVYTPALGQKGIEIAAGSAGFAYIPEPTSLGLLGLGFAGLLASRRRV